MVQKVPVPGGASLTWLNPGEYGMGCTAKRSVPTPAPPLAVIFDVKDGCCCHAALPSSSEPVQRFSESQQVSAYYDRSPA